jgi:hypothetical protein
MILDTCSLDAVFSINKFNCRRFGARVFLSSLRSMAAADDDQPEKTETLSLLGFGSNQDVGT